MSNKNELVTSELTNIAMTGLTETVVQLPELLGKIGELMNEKAQMIAINKAAEYDAQKQVLMKSIEAEVQLEVTKLEATQYSRDKLTDEYCAIERAFGVAILKANDKEEREQLSKLWNEASERYNSNIKGHMPDERGIFDKMGDFFNKLRLKR